jgi:hypothetical protein
MRKRGTMLTPNELYRLNAACLAMAPAFGFNFYLVGSVLTDREHRDVDVRCIVSDAEFRARFPNGFDANGGVNFNDPWLALVHSLISEQMSLTINMRVDFSIQPQSYADTQTGIRSALGIHAGAFTLPE